MWDLTNILNQCVKCESKFTTPEKPLKLLPCLHSMCLDCLNGRVPACRAVTTASEVAKDRKDTNTWISGIDSNSNLHSLQHDSENEAVNNINAETKSKENSSKKDKVDSAELEDSENTDSSKEKNREKSHAAKLTEFSLLDIEFNQLNDKRNDGIIDTPPLSRLMSIETELESLNSLNRKNTQNNENTELQPKDVKQTPVTECPVCRDPIDQPYAGLMDNMFAAFDPDQLASPTADSIHLCTACEENQEAGSYCLQCEEWLCDSCVDAHRRVRITKDHIISPKDEVKVVTNKSPWEQLMTCKQHKQEHLKFFCEKCETLTCRDCQLMDHKEHKYQFLDQAAEQYKARLKGSLALMGEKRAKLNSSREEIEQKLQNCKEQKDALQQDILKQADILVKGVRQAVWGVLSNLASFTDAATKRLNKEMDDVSDLILKFDHSIQFMEDILKEGSSMSLLYSKGNVETKCRKVYHTQVDPQSLKGTLSILYKHDVNWLLGSLNKIGAIYVNGVRYPADKNGQGSRPSQTNCGYQDPRSPGFSATSPHLQHMANQAVPGQRVPSDWTKFIQTVSKSVTPTHGPPNMTMSPLGTAASLPPQLTLLSNRRAQGHAMVQAWQVPPVIPAIAFPGHLVTSQLMTPQQQTTKPAFTPMRLHHRPATQTGFPGQMDHRSQSMHSPPQYRTGGEASGTPRSSHSTPDPARPASAGMYDGIGRSDSEGGSAMVDVKKERHDNSPDCVIMSSSSKIAKSSIFTSPKQSETVLEMQRNLDEVLRAVPMDLSDNMEQISGSKPRTSVDMEQLKSPTMTTLAGSCENREEPRSPTDEELRQTWQGGNSMPGFSLSQTDSHGDPNDDYCACCHNGGDVLCCDRCPKVFHLHCHIPELSSVPSGSFVCTICEGDSPVSNEEVTGAGKRKSLEGLSDQEVKACERILLELFCHPSSLPFQEPVNKMQVPNYYRIITQPKDFMQIKRKLQRSHPNHYQSIKSFLYDMRQVFINCAIYNKTGSEVGKAGKIVRALFESLVEHLMPQYINFVKESPTPCFSALQQQMDLGTQNTDDNTGDAVTPKRAKLDE